jgi:hypothetical protein
MSESKVYYRDRLGRRRVLRPSTILRKARRLPGGYHMAIFWSDRDEIAFGAPLSPSWHSMGPYIVEVPWNLSKYGAKNAFDAILEEFTGQRSRVIKPKITEVKA